MTVDFTGTYIEIEEIDPAPKTRRFVVVTKAADDLGIRLGTISWYGPWRRYAFFPEERAVFEEGCLREIAGFVEARTKGHREMLAQARRRKSR